MSLTSQPQAYRKPKLIQLRVDKRTAKNRDPFEKASQNNENPGGNQGKAQAVLEYSQTLGPGGMNGLS